MDIPKEALIEKMNSGWNHLAAVVALL